MARITRVVLTCDWCDTDSDDVKNRRFDLEGKRRQLESCDPCWESATVRELLDTGRQIRGGKRKKLVAVA